jgi:hypothetical protein
MNIIKRIAKSVGQALVRFSKEEGEDQIHALINVDRAVASEFGAPVDYTISGESQQHESLTPLKDVLNKIQPGHTEGALSHDQYIQAADEQITAEDKKEGLP